MADTSTSFLSASEAERLVENLTSFSLKEIGSGKWLEQHKALQKLNLQAHINASANADEFVSEAFITFEKLPTLVHELIAIETWKRHIFPDFKSYLAENCSMRAYFVVRTGFILSGTGSLVNDPDC